MGRDRAAPQSDAARIEERLAVEGDNLIDLIDGTAIDHVDGAGCGLFRGLEDEPHIPSWGQRPKGIELTGHARQAEGIANMKALIQGFCDQGGTLMNLNVLSREQLLEAHGDPNRHPDLIVRVTGFSAYFRMLSPEFRQLVVDRIISDS